MKGDIIGFDKSNEFINLSPGSIVKILKVKDNSIDHPDVDSYVMRCNMSGSFGVTIVSPFDSRLGIFWGSYWDNYSFEIIREI